MKDALGQSLVIGAKYGYTSTSNGFTNIVVGHLSNIGAKKCTLRVESRTTYVYGRVSESSRHEEHPTSCSVQSFHLFPVA